MPELPEVESFAKALSEKYTGKTIRMVSFHRDDIRTPLPIRALREIFRDGAIITDISREGKRLVITTTTGAVRVSLGMSGAFMSAEPNTRKKHEHITIHFHDAPPLAYVDPRRFGIWDVHDGVGTPSIDPLSASALKELFLSQKFSESSRSIKTALMDQRMIGGIGNIYALEALHLAHVAPHRPCRSLNEEEKEALAKVIAKILARAIEMGGSTIRTYRSLHGKKGDFQSLHRVYDREGETCLKKGCGGIIVRQTQGGRGSWYCAKCQR